MPGRGVGGWLWFPQGARIAISEYPEVHEVRGAIKLLILTTVKVRGVDGNQEVSAGEAHF